MAKKYGEYMPKLIESLKDPQGAAEFWAQKDQDTGSNKGRPYNWSRQMERSNVIVNHLGMTNARMN